MTCLRFSALALGSDDCTAAEIVNVIDNDPLKLGLFTTDTDLQTCVGGRISFITCVKQPLSKRPKFIFRTNYRLMQV